MHALKRKLCTVLKLKTDENWYTRIYVSGSCIIYDDHKHFLRISHVNHTIFPWAGRTLSFQTTIVGEVLIIAMKNIGLFINCVETKPYNAVKK